MNGKLIYLIALLACCSRATLSAQGSDEYGSGIKIELGESGKKYIRFITWHQFWLRMAENSIGDWRVTPSLRRSRFLAYSQINKRFLILTHFGLNNLNPSGLDPVGQSAQTQLFLHDAWTEFTVIPNLLYIGGGLHYWNGLARYNSASTLNFMPLDNARFLWPNLGTTDQFARHLGVYAKGQLGRLDYRFSIDEAMVNSLDAQRKIPLSSQYVTYRGHELKGDQAGGAVYQGYFKYMFKDKEANMLPYAVGSYLGTKKVFNIGAGYYIHPSGTVRLKDNWTMERTGTDSLVTHTVKLLAADVYYDAPIGYKEMAVSLYAGYFHYDYGRNYRLLNTSTEIATSDIVYMQCGLLLPDIIKQARIMPYLQLSNRSIQALEKDCNTWGIGSNFFLEGHNAKITVEYTRNSNYIPKLSKHKNSEFVTLQLHIYL
jgi:hypothetical protein